VALPSNSLSTSNAVLQFESPRDIAKLSLEDWDKGGVNVNDASQGLLVYNWRCYFDGSAILVEVPGVVLPQLLYTQAGIAELAFTWDQSMRPFIAWQLEDGTCQYRWFDPTVPGFVVSDLPSGSKNPRCQLDDKRVAQSSASDIILAYMNSGELRYRQQRDRYLTERVLKTGLGTRSLLQIGMSRAFRFQFRLRG
jgi:hypothetical protein